MSIEVVFRKKYGWTILPYERKVDLQSERENSQIYEEHFRWFRRNRVGELCRPWRLSHEIGWIISSPIDVNFTPLHDFEVSGSSEDTSVICDITASNELWKRDKTSLAIHKVPWLRFYDFRTSNGWEAMFLPNGQGSVEWRLGWEMYIPDGHYIMIMPIDNIIEIDVIGGVLDSKTLHQMNQSLGMSIGIRPRRSIEIRRHQPIARIILLHPDSLQAVSRYETN